MHHLWYLVKKISRLIKIFVGVEDCKLKTKCVLYVKLGCY
jgi:hypothetical protein